MLNVTGLLICYSSWDDLDKAYDGLKKILKDSSVGVYKAYNTNAVPYPWTLALVVKDDAALKELDTFLTGGNFSHSLAVAAALKGEHEMYVGQERVNEFFLMLPLQDYLPGFLKVQFGRCEIKAGAPGACMLCQYGHMTECHYPQTCDEAQCSHMERYDI